MLKAIVNGVLVILTLLYPVAVYFGLQSFEPRLIALVLLALFCLRLLVSFLGARNKQPQPMQQLPLIVGTVFIAGIVVSNSQISLLFYPVLMNALLLVVFGLTLIKPPSMIERLARLTEPDLPEQAIGYTRNVTRVWCTFFLLNGLTALYTALCTTMEIWSLYNGFISYVLMGLLFAIEFLVRLRVKKRHAAESESTNTP